MRWLVLVITLALASPAFATDDCATPPAGKIANFRHKRSYLLSKLGSPRHRGVDLVALASDENQTLGGKLTYTKADKDLEDEDVEIFACVGRAWRSLGTRRTDDDGRFTLTLSGDARLPAGMTDLYAFVPGDGSGTRFLGYVARANEQVIVTDVDGTITISENAVYRQLLGKDIAHQPHAPEVLAASGKVIVYVSARGEQLTQMTRDWLHAHGFPPGPVRFARSFVTLPGKRTVELKSTTLDGLRVPIAACVGNRASDITAYRNAGIPADRIFINLPEFTPELRDALARGEATPFDHYADLRERLSR